MTIKLNCVTTSPVLHALTDLEHSLHVKTTRMGAALCARGVAGDLQVAHYIVRSSVSIKDLFLLQVAEAHRRRAASARGRALGRRQPGLFHVHCQLPHVPLHTIHRVRQQKRLHRSRYENIFQEYYFPFLDSVNFFKYCNFCYYFLPPEWKFFQHRRDAISSKAAGEQ
jgi:hypothetical protein